jgi:hypothetical protein
MGTSGQLAQGVRGPSGGRRTWTRCGPSLQREETGRLTSRGASKLCPWIRQTTVARVGVGNPRSEGEKPWRLVEIGQPKLTGAPVAPRGEVGRRTRLCSIHRLPAAPALRRLDICVGDAGGMTPVGSDRSWDGLFQPFPAHSRRQVPSPPDRRRTARKNLKIGLTPWTGEPFQHLRRIAHRCRQPYPLDVPPC